MSSTSLYGRSYDYNLETGEFTIEDSTGLPTAWNDNNYRSLIGTYTCLSNLATCNTLYYVGGYNSSTTALVSKYTIGDVADYSQMGKSSFSPYIGSASSVGYMFNSDYYSREERKSREYFTTAIWNGTSYDLTSGNGGPNPDETHHYICDTDCTKVRYYYYSEDYYILLESGETVEDALYKMTGNGSVETKAKTINANYKLNKYNSAIKGYLDNWYAKNLVTYTNYLDNTSVYCNDRSIRNLGGWNPTGTSLTGSLNFNFTNNLNCANDVDRFAVVNSKAELTYPIGLLTIPEAKLVITNYVKMNNNNWTMSPESFTYYNARVNYVPGGSSSFGGNLVYYNYAVRGVITLKHNTKLEGGTGTYLDPFIIGPIVSKTN